MGRHSARIFVLMFTILFSVLSMGTAWAWTYYVQKGDSLYFIGRRFNVSTGKLKEANGLNSNTIYPGQKLWIPEKSDSTYTVRAGDTLYSIAQRFDTTPYAIRSANALKSNLIWPGQRLFIPAQTRATRNTNRAQLSRGGYDRNQVMLLARLIYGEARGESFTGQVAIAAVALNRVESPLFPNSLQGVIYQPWAFTAVYDGQFYLQPDQTAIKAAKAALNGWDPSGGALYYWNPANATNQWVWTRTITNKIGKHLFAI